MEYVCVKTCFYNRLWKPGETLVAKPGEKLPRHFVPEEAYKKVENKPKRAEPQTFSGIHEQEAKELLARARNKTVEEIDEFLK